MGDFRIEGPRFQALDRAYDALEKELNSSGEIEKYLETAYKMAGILGQNQKKTENEIAKEAEEQARKTNKKQVATYNGTGYHVLTIFEGIAHAGAGLTPIKTGKMDHAKMGRYIAQSISTAKGWKQNQLEAQRSEHGSNKSSLDEQGQRMRGSATQNGQNAQEKIQTADQIAQSKLRAMQSIASA